MKDKTWLVRVVRNADGSGRGAYICKDAACFKKAVKSKGFERSLKQKLPLEIYDEIESEIAGE